MNERDISTAEERARGLQVKVLGAPKLTRKDLDFGPPEDKGDVWILVNSDYDSCNVMGAYRTVQAAMNHNLGTWTWLGRGWFYKADNGWGSGHLEVCSLADE